MTLLASKNKKSFFFIKLVVFYCLLSSAQASMTLGNNPYHDLLLSIICLLFFVSHNCFVKKVKNLIASSVLLCASMYTMHEGSLIGSMAMASMVAIPAMLINLKDEIKIELLEDFSKWFAILILMSALAWILYKFGFNLPHYSKIDEVKGNAYGVVVNNYYLFRESIMLNPYVSDSLGGYRFNGFFLEPGHMGTIVSFFLFANRFDFSQKYNLIFLFVIFITLSAAAYVITAIGYILFRMSSGSFLKLLGGLFILFIVVFLITQINDGDNIVNEFIFGKITRETGMLDGRVSDDGKQIYETMWEAGDYWFGYGTSAQPANSAGIKVFLIMHGIVGLLLFVCVYYLIYATNKSKLGFFMFILYMINFSQRSYCTWDAFLDPYILSLPLFIKEKIKTTDANS